MPKDDIKTLLDEVKQHRKTEIGRLSDPDVRLQRPRMPRPDSLPMRPPVSEPPVSSAPELDQFSMREAITAQGLPRPRNVPRRADPVDGPLAELAGVTPSIMAQAARVPLARMLILIAASGAAVTGVVAAIGAAVVNVVTALRPPSHVELQKELDAVKTRVNGDFGLPLEVKTRQEKDKELEDKIDKLAKEQQKLANQLPQKVKVRLNPKAATE